MARKLETVFRARVVKKIKKELPNVAIFSIDQEVIRGTPDLIFCVEGLFVAWELKSTANCKVAPLQTWNIERIEKAGGVAGVVHPDNFKTAFDYLKKLATT